MILYVNKAGDVDWRKHRPRSRLGIDCALIAGVKVEGFVSIYAEKFLGEMVWASSPQRYQQLQIGASQ